MQRRAFLRGAGLAAVAAAGGGLWRAVRQGSFSAGAGPAYQPWSTWRKDLGEGLLPMVRAAILAASPHNSQPWKFRVRDGAIELYLDPQRNLGALDPYLREAHLGLGCALENLVLAAVARGSALDVQPVPGRLGPVAPGAGPVLVARVAINACIQHYDDLYEAIPRRHTNRAAYLPHRPVPPPFLDALGALAGAEPGIRLVLLGNAADRASLVALSAEANAGLYADPQLVRDHERWLRLDPDELRSRRDGLTLDAFGLAPAAAGLAKLMPRWLLRRAVARGAARGYSERMASAPLMGILAVRDRLDREQCLLAGRVWQRAHLLATVHGLAARPCNEAVEMVDRSQALGRPARWAGRLGEFLPGGWEPTFVFLMGYPERPARPSPRRPVEQVLL